MEKLKGFILNEYKERSLQIRRKAYYTIVFALMLFIFIASAAVIDIIVGRFDMIKAFEFGFYIVGILICYFFFQFGHIEVTGNIFIVMGLIRTISTYYIDHSIDNMIVITMLGLLITAVIYIKKYQVIMVYISYLIIYVITASTIMIQYDDRSLEVIQIGDMVYGFIALLIYMVICIFIIQIINEEIKHTTELEVARATSMLYFGEMEKFSDSLEEMAITDKLTGILNRRKFTEILNSEIDKSNRYNRSLGLLMIDLDHFKEVNDKFGHIVGDSVLKEFVDVVSKDIRKTDHFVRWGGEEFIVITPELDLKHAKIFGEKLRETVENYEFDVIGHITASIGVVIYKQDESVEKMINRLDKNMYCAKEQGRNCVIG